jgi:hypothetical protein
MAGVATNKPSTATASPLRLRLYYKVARVGGVRRYVQYRAQGRW